MDVQITRETPSSEDLVAAYNSVFSLRGGAAIAGGGTHVEYTEDLVRRLLGADASAPLDLGFVRSLPQSRLLRLLFKAVAGDFISGPSALRGDVCRLQADPVSGTLEVTRDGGDNEVVLTVISLILLAVLAVMLYRREKAAAGADAQ